MDNRLKNALVQKLYFIEERIIDNTKREYLIMGSTGNVYTVTISDTNLCSCPDHTKRKVKCKHIYFVLVKILKVDSKYMIVKKYKPNDLINIFSKMTLIDNEIIIPDDKKIKYETIINNNEDSIIDNRKLDNDICPICLDDILDLKLAYYCKKSCGKNVHIECFNMWAKQKGSICVFCNANWNSDKYTYINLN